MSNEAMVSPPSEVSSPLSLCLSSSQLHLLLNSVSFRPYRSLLVSVHNEHFLLTPTTYSLAPPPPATSFSPLSSPPLGVLNWRSLSPSNHNKSTTSRWRLQPPLERAFAKLRTTGSFGQKAGKNKAGGREAEL